MNLRDAIQKAGQIMDEERVEPTVRYDLSPVITDPGAIFTAISKRGERPRRGPREPRRVPIQEWEFRSSVRTIGSGSGTG
jgi:hypothetical protein